VKFVDLRGLLGHMADRLFHIQSEKKLLYRNVS